MLCDRIKIGCQVTVCIALNIAITGICRNVDAEVTRTILIDGIRLSLENVLKIESAADIFKKDWEDPWS